MKTVILYNIISLIIIFVLIFVLRIVSKSDLRKNQQLIIKVITTILIVKRTTLIISKKPGNTGISRDIRTEFTTDLLLSD